MHGVSTDAKTGMQTLERLHPTRPTTPGLIEPWEFEYIRRGTLALIANFGGATGKIIAPTMGPTRTEEDFAAHLRRPLETDPEAGWICVVDQLNIHQSEALVRIVASAVRRDVVQHLGASVAQAGEFHLGGGFAPTCAGVYCVL